MRFLAFFAIFSIFFTIYAGSAQAADPLDFHSQIGRTSLLNIDQYLQPSGENHSGLLIAATDLNGDGLNEFILRDKNCDLSQKTCDFKIIAENDDKIIKLGEIQAHNLKLGNEYSQGIRSVFAFNNSENDYDYTVYIWNGEARQYIIKK